MSVTARVGPNVDALRHGRASVSETHDYVVGSVLGVYGPNTRGTLHGSMAVLHAVERRDAPTAECTIVHASTYKATGWQPDAYTGPPWLDVPGWVISRLDSINAWRRSEWRRCHAVAMRGPGTARLPCCRSHLRAWVELVGPIEAHTLAGLFPCAVDSRPALAYRLPGQARERVWCNVENGDEIDVIADYFDGVTRSNEISRLVLDMHIVAARLRGDTDTHRALLKGRRMAKRGEVQP